MFDFVEECVIWKLLVIFVLDVVVGRDEGSIFLGVYYDLFISDNSYVVFGFDVNLCGFVFCWCECLFIYG